MTLQQLSYFIALADTLHYTKAAQSLYVSQPSLSRAISELEKELGAPLFLKDGKNTVLTKYGTAFLPFAQDAISKIEDGKRTIENMLAPTPTIRLGYIYSLSFSVLPRTLESFLAADGNKDIHFAFYQGMNSAIVERLKKGELDIALALEPDDPAIEATSIFRQDLYLVVPQGHHLAKKSAVLLQDLKDESFVTINPSSSLRQQLDNIFETLDATPKITFEAEECNAMASFVSAGLGIAIMPEIPALRSYNVEMLPISDKPLFRHIDMLTVRGRALPPEVERFGEFLTRNKIFI